MATTRPKVTDYRSKRIAWQKVAIAISDVRPTARPEIVEVTLVATGKPMRLRRDMVEFWPGRVVVPLWLGAKVGA